MSEVSCYTLCLDCRVRAPELGRAGMMGAPSLELVSGSMEHTELYSFGWIYDGLRSVSFLPREVESYREFLERHLGHRVALGNNQRSRFSIDDWQSWPCQDARADDTDDTDGACRTGMSDRFRFGIYEVSTNDGAESFRTSKSAHFRDFGQRPLSELQVANFLDRLNPDTEESLFQVSKVVDPFEDLGRLVDFFELFGHHPLRARVV